MGLVREKRAERLIQNALMKYLDKGLIPTSGELEAEYEALESQHGDLVRSSIRRTQPPQRYAQSSASGLQTFVDNFAEDVDILLKSLIEVANLSVTTLNTWDARAQSLEARLYSLKNRLESLFLMKSDAAGYIAFIEDGFSTLENISSETTANINTVTGEATLREDPTKGAGASQGTLIDTSSASVEWNLLDKSVAKFTSTPSGGGISHAMTDSPSAWKSEVYTPPLVPRDPITGSPKPVTIEVKVNLQRQYEISRIELITDDATLAVKNIIAAMYSVDGYTWERVPGESPVQSGREHFEFRFPKTAMQWVKFFISKSAPDDITIEGGLYQFGLRRIGIYSEEFIVDQTGSLLQTEVRTPILADQNISFGRASLEVCQEVPTETSIDYYMRAYDGTTYTSWVKTSPINSGAESTPTAIIDFTAPQNLSSEDLTTVFDNSLDTEALNLSRIDGTGNLVYRFSGPNETVSNFYISQTENLLSDFVFLRNISYPAAKFPNITTDLQVGDVECGWGLQEENIYYCNFWVKNPGGLNIDFGTTQARIDGRSCSGLFNVPQGWHLFETTRAHWAPITGTVPTSSAELDTIDPLYPYNHKYLIEGFDQPEGFQTVSHSTFPYIGGDIVAQYRGTRVGFHEFSSKPIDFSIYAVDHITNPTKTFILLKVDSSRPNYENERIRFLYTRRFESYTGIQMKAILKTDNSLKTPVLSYYRIKVK